MCWVNLQVGISKMCPRQDEGERNCDCPMSPKGMKWNKSSKSLVKCIFWVKTKGINVDCLYGICLATAY
jgi:hypothetical protein